MKICFVASSGGHWEELMCLRELIDENESFCVTEQGGQAEDSKIGKKVYALDKIDRKEKGFFGHFVRLWFRAGSILRREKPDVIVSTGALLSYPFCLLGWLKRKKVIYIESFARVQGLSLTGKLLYPIATHFVVQWPDLQKKYPKTICLGSIF